MRHWRTAAGQFVVLVAFWMALSDQWRPAFLALGAVSAAAVTALTHRIIGTILLEPGQQTTGAVRRIGWFVVYIVWMLGRILVASGQQAYFALHPGLPFQPRMVRFRTTMRRPFSRVVLANSITSVPGTLTVRLDGDEFLVHTLIPGSADDLSSARMQNFIARFLGEELEEPPEMVWGPLIEEAVR